MEKIILIAVIILLNTFTACKNAEKDKMVIESKQTAITTTVETNIETSLSETKPKNTETEVTEVTTVQPNFPKDEVIQAFADVIQRGNWIRFGDILYDLDFDGTPEFLQAEIGSIDNLIWEIYKYIDNSTVKVGNFGVGGFWNDWEVTSGLSKYYDPKTNEYFYISESGYGDKGIVYVAEMERFQFNNNEYKKSTIAKCEFKFISTDGATDSHLNILSNTFLGKENTPIGMQKVSDITCYYDGVEEYLSQFTKIEDIDLNYIWESPYDNLYDNMYYNYYIKDKESSSSLIVSDTTKFSSAD